MKVLALTAAIELPDDARQQGQSITYWHAMIDNFFDGIKAEFKTEVRTVRPKARKTAAA